MRGPALLLLGLGLACVVPPAPAWSNSSGTYFTAFNTRYPGFSRSSCFICHTTSPPQGSPDSNLSAYGLSFRAQANHGSDPGAALIAIEDLDSDNDGFSNLREILALYLPGYPYDPDGPLAFPPDRPGVNVSPDSSAKSGLPGAAVSYTVTVSNTGQEWSVPTPAPPAGPNRNFDLTVTDTRVDGPAP